MKQAFWTLILSVIPLSVLSQTSFPTVDEIVASHIQATGGSAAWQKLATQSRKGIALPGIANLPLESYARAPGMWTYTVRFPNGRTMKHGFDGAQGWEERGTASVLERDAVLDEALIYDPFWVLRLKDLFPGTSVKRIERNGAGQVYVVEAAPREGRRRILFFDVSTRRLVRAGKVMYGDYRESGGVMVPYLVRYGPQTFQFDEIRHGEAIDEARFRMPAAAAPPAKADQPAVDKNLPAAAGILDRYLAAAGGEQAFERVTTQLRKGTLEEGGQRIPVETAAKAPGKWLLVLHTGAASPDKEGYDGKTGWSQSGDLIKDMNPQQHPDLDTFLNCQLPLKLSRLRAAMTVIKKEARGKQEVYILQAAAGTRPRTLAFDVKTGLLVQADGVLFDDYRDVNGLNVPFAVKLEGGHFGVRFTEIAHNLPVEDARFGRPSPGPAFLKNFAGLNDRQALPVLQRVVGRGVTPSDGRMLYDLVAEKKYKRVLDIGTAEGYSALWFGLAAKANGGEVITIEIDPEVADQARENIRQAGLDGVIDSRINDALLEIPALKGDFDFVFIDTGVPLNKQVFALVQQRISPGGAVAAHNASSLKTQQPDFLKALDADPRMETRIVPSARGGILISTRTK